VITAATVKLFPQIRARATALVALPDVRAAVTLLGELRAGSGDRISSFELISRPALELATRHIPGVSDPLSGAHPWYLLCELSSARAAEPLDEVLEEALGAALTRATVLDAALVRSERERAALWKLRESIPEAQRHEGASLKHDISLPVAVLADFVARAASWIGANVPMPAGGVRPRGDGNLHFNISQSEAVTASAFSVAPTACGAPCTSWYTSSRQLQRRARGGSDQGGGARALRLPGRARAHARREARVRPTRHNESGQGPARAMKEPRMVYARVAAAPCCSAPWRPAAGTPRRRRARSRGRRRDEGPRIAMSPTTCTSTTRLWTRRPAVVLVHGWASDANYWNAQLEALKSRYTVVALTSPATGFGQQPQRLSIANYAQDVAAVARQIPTHAWCWSGTPWELRCRWRHPLIGTRVIA